MSSGKFTVRGEFVDEASGETGELYYTNGHMHLQVSDDESCRILDSRDDVVINPLNGPGDLIVGDVDGDPVTLSKGDAGEFLMAGEDGVSWEELPTASSSTPGVIKVGDRLTVSQDGTLSADDQSYTLPAATASTLGGVKVGDRLSVSSDGTLSADVQSYTLPVATPNVLGGIKPDGTTLSVDSTTGVASVVGSGGGGYTLPAATASTLGGIKVGDRLSVTSDGTLSATDQSYALPAATASTLGGIKVGSGLSISNGVLSADTGQSVTSYLSNCVTQSTSTGITYTTSTGNITIPSGFSVLFPNGRNSDGTLKSTAYTFTSYTTLSGASISATILDVYNDRTNTWKHSTNGGSSWTTVQQVIVGRYHCNGSSMTNFIQAKPVMLWHNMSCIGLTKLINPTNQYVNIAISSNGATYTAPADGWMAATGMTSSTNGYITLINETTGIVNGDSTYQTDTKLTASIPVNAGDQVVFKWRSALSENMTFKFIYSGASLCI